MMKKINKYSSSITQDNSQPAAQAMLYAVGFSDEDFNKIAVKIKKLPKEKRTLNRIFSTALFNKPRLIIDVIKVFAGI